MIGAVKKRKRRLYKLKMLMVHNLMEIKSMCDTTKKSEKSDSCLNCKYG